jgi:hypothetical protein
MIEPHAIGYNVCMDIDEYDTPPINEQEPCEAEDQFDDDLWRHLEARIDPTSDRQPSRPQ